MFSKVALFVATTFAVMIAADSIQNSCNTGSVKCCNSVQNADSIDQSILSSVAQLAGIDVSQITGQVGLNCSPITAVGASGTSCSAQPACCTGDEFNGVLNLGCSPTNLNL